MIYNNKSDQMVQDKILKYFCSITNDIEDEYYRLRRNESLSLYLTTLIAKGILSKLLQSNIENLTIYEGSNFELLNDDENEIIVTIAYDGMLFIESARSNLGNLKPSESHLTYIYDSFRSKDVKWLANNNRNILVFGFEENNDLFEIKKSKPFRSNLICNSICTNRWILSKSLCKWW